MFPWVASRANMLHLAMRTHNRVTVCPHAFHFDTLREFWTDWLSTETACLPQNVEPRLVDAVSPDSGASTAYCIGLVVCAAAAVFGEGYFMVFVRHVISTEMGSQVFCSLVGALQHKAYRVPLGSTFCGKNRVSGGLTCCI